MSSTNTLPWIDATTMPLRQRVAEAKAASSRLREKGIAQRTSVTIPLEQRIQAVTTNARNGFFAIPSELVRGYPSFNDARGPWLDLMTERDLRKTHQRLLQYDFPAVASPTNFAREGTVLATHLLGARVGVPDGIGFEFLIPEAISAYTVAQAIQNDMRVRTARSGYLGLDFPGGIKLTIRGVKAQEPSDFQADLVIPSRSLTDLTGEPVQHQPTYHLEALSRSTREGLVHGVFDMPSSDYPQFGVRNFTWYELFNAHLTKHNFTTKRKGLRRRRANAGHILGVYLIEHALKQRYGLMLNTPFPAFPKQWTELAQTIAEKSYIINRLGERHKPAQMDAARIFTTLVAGGYLRG